MRVSLILNQQQLDLLERSVRNGAAPDVPSLIRRAIREYGTPGPAPSPAAGDAPPTGTDPPRRRLLEEWVLEPGTGKALEVRQGQILKIELIEGPQCVDFNCFNLHDYKEAMHVGRIRAWHGLHPTAGSYIWSAAPRDRAMLYFLTDTARCNDVMFARCHPYLYEAVYGFTEHTNCHDIQAEAQREFGLTPDDVHDSFNFFMKTEVVGDRPIIQRQHAQTGDHVELLALMDVLAVPNVCGNDLGRTSNFALKPVKLSIFEADSADLAKVPQLPVYTSNLRCPANYKQPHIKADRELRRDERYVAEFTNVPLRQIQIEVFLDDDEHQKLLSQGLEPFYGADLGAMLRDVVLSWWSERSTGHTPGK